MSFFRDMTFARVMIVVCLLGSGVLGYFVFQNHQKIRSTSKALEPGGGIEQLVRDIQRQSKEYSQLYEKKDDEKLRGQASPNTYIVKIATGDHVDIGRVDIDADEKDVTKDIVDNVYSITPTEKDFMYTRVHIANFLWSLENESRKVRVTKFKMDALNAEGKPRLKPHEIPTDSWKFTCEMTSRQRRGG